MHCLALAVYTWFWDAVEGICRSDEIDRGSCQKCYSYSVTMCKADATTCHQDGSDGTKDNNACPYSLCRAQMLRYLYEKFSK